MPSNCGAVGADAFLQSRMEDSIALLLIDLGNRLTRVGEAISRRVDLTVQQWMVLLQIAGDPNFPTAEAKRGLSGAVLSSRIAADRGVSRALISATVSELMKRGLVVQSDDPKDRRRKQLTVTDSGVAALRDLQTARCFANDRLLSDLDTHERQTLSEQLAAMWERISHIDETLARFDDRQSAAD